MFCVLMAIKALLVSSSLALPRRCDHINRIINEGNIGVTSAFPWLGLLKVYLHQDNTERIALTGIVLVKDGFAIANADDVIKIPHSIFMEDSQAMFIPKDNEPWFCNLRGYLVHPEYENSILNTIAIIELDLGEADYFPMKPICWPKKSKGSTHNLYAVGFTDDNVVLEKTLYSLQHVDQVACYNYYNSSGLIDSKLTATQYRCGFAKNYHENCVWDNGMVLASNSSHYWTLVGFSILGPGCAAPARFIDMLSYLPWIESSINLNGPETRKSNLNFEFLAGVSGPTTTTTTAWPDFLILDTMLETSVTPLKSELLQNMYPFDTEVMKDTNYDIMRINKTAFVIIHPARMVCTKDLIVVYREETRILSSNPAMIEYRLTLYDMFFGKLTCIKLHFKPKDAVYTKPLIFIEATINHFEGASFGEFGETPKQYIKETPIKTVTYTPDPLKPKDLGAWRQDNETTKYMKHKKSEQNKKKTAGKRLYYYNVMVRFKFFGEGALVVEVMGLPSSMANNATKRRKKPKRRGMPVRPRGDHEIKKHLKGTGIARTDFNLTRVILNKTRESNPLGLLLEVFPKSPGLVKESALVKDLVSCGVEIGSVNFIQVIAMDIFLFCFLY